MRSKIKHGNTKICLNYVSDCVVAHISKLNIVTVFFVATQPVKHLLIYTVVITLQNDWHVTEK